MSEVPLKYPITVNGQKVEKLTFTRRGTVKDLRMAARFGSGAEDREIALFAILCGVVPEDLDQMDIVDYGALQDAYLVMTNGGGGSGTGTFPAAGPAVVADGNGVSGQVVGVPAQ